MVDCLDSNWWWAPAIICFFLLFLGSIQNSFIAHQIISTYEFKSPEMSLWIRNHHIVLSWSNINKFNETWYPNNQIYIYIVVFMLLGTWKIIKKCAFIRFHRKQSSGKNLSYWNLPFRKYNQRYIELRDNKLFSEQAYSREMSEKKRKKKKQQQHQHQQQKKNKKTHWIKLTQNAGKIKFHLTTERIDATRRNSLCIGQWMHLAIV